MPSTLYRLFRYAKATKAEALENFTTEALAAAIARDPGPLIDVLRELDLLRYDEAPTAVNAQTQVVVPGAGVIDLDLTLEGSSWVRELWVEVKVQSGESGSQLAAYQRVIDELTHPPRLLVLSKAPLPGHNDVPWLGWQVLWHAARHHSASPYWHDLAQLLKEIGMADEYDSPIVAREAATLLDAHALYAKTSRIVAQVVEEGKVRWPALGWPKSTNDADEQLLWQFKGWRRITLPVRTNGPVKLFFGLAQHDTSADFDEREPHLCVWLDHNPKQVDLRQRLLDRADAGGLGPAWQRRLPGWWALTEHERIGAFADHAEATAWVLDRFQELDAAGVLAMLTTSGWTTTAIEGGEEPSDAG